MCLKHSGFTVRAQSFRCPESSVFKARLHTLQRRAQKQRRSSFYVIAYTPCSSPAHQFFRWALQETFSLEYAEHNVGRSIQQPAKSAADRAQPYEKHGGTRRNASNFGFYVTRRENARSCRLFCPVLRLNHQTHTLLTAPRQTPVGSLVMQTTKPST